MDKTTSHSTDGHKFDKPMSRPLTYRQRFELEYASHFIPYLKILEKEISREKIIETLHKLALKEAEEYARHVVRAKGKNDLSVFKEDYSPHAPVSNDIMTIEVLENAALRVAGGNAVRIQTLASRPSRLPSDQGFHAPDRFRDRMQGISPRATAHPAASPNAS